MFLDHWSATNDTPAALDARLGVETLNLIGSWLFRQRTITVMPLVREGFPGYVLIGLGIV